MNPLIIDSTPSTPVPRPVASFTPCPWGDRFLNYTPDIKVIEAQKERAKELKEEVRRDLLYVDAKPLIEQLCLIDSVERLGVGYHFEKEIQDALQRINETSTDPSADDLVLTSLRFRLLRQHGFKVSSGVFKEFIGSNGSLKEDVGNDIQGMLSLYEACYVRIHGEDILEEALPLITSKLSKSISDHQLRRPLLEERVRYALVRPLHKRVTRYECVRYMQVYEEDDPLYNKTLLKFAKVDFNMVQESHKEELVELCRWDKSCLDQLPENLRWFYQTLILDAHEEIERLVAPIGRSHYMHYAKQEIKALCRSYLTEARWRHKKYVPTLDEYMENDLYRNTAYVAAIIYFFIGLDTVTDREFEWLCNLASPVKAICYQMRILNDIGGYKFDVKRGLSSLLIECYMKEYGLSFEEACEKMYKNADESWKDINEGMIQPSEVAVPAFNTILNMARVAESIYEGGEDALTLSNHAMKQTVKTLYIDSIPM